MVTIRPVRKLWCVAALLLVSACSDSAFSAVLRNPCAEPIVFEVRLFNADSIGPPSLHEVASNGSFQDFWAIGPPDSGLIVSVPSLGYEEEWMDPPASSYRVFQPEVSTCREEAARDDDS